MTRRRRERDLPNLRPPTLMIDLLFGALMLFAFQMGDPSAHTIVPRGFDLPTAADDAKREPVSLLPLRPARDGAGAWAYVTPEGARLTAAEVRARVQARGETAILLVAADAPVQNYLDAEQPLRRLGIKAGLAVAIKGAEP